MNWTQHDLTLAPRRRGFHPITSEVTAAVPELSTTRVGLMHLFLLHTSASLTINENADPDVPRDLEVALNAIAPETLPFAHTCEGPDDMPGHVKSALLGASLTIPVGDGQLRLGTWQGVYLCEHRNHAGPRRLVLTLWGD
ncbi:MAG: secondary thiamine-phosphate synthase enzyme YjbQ [Planctomycetota bacterium]